MNKEIRRRIKIIDSMPSEESTMKIIYLRATEINDKWSMRSLRGYYKCIDEIKEIFQDRYPSRLHKILEAIFFKERIARQI